MLSSASRPPFHMIRHGQTDWNRESRYQGQTDIPLNATGRAQAAGNGRMLAAAGADWSGWEFYSSPLVRARETMRIVRRELDLDPEGFQIDDRLIEIGFGTWENKLLSELRTAFPEEMARRDADKWNHAPPGGESYASAVERVSAFLDGLTGPAVIVCHGGILRAVRFLFERETGQAIADQPVPQDNIYCFDGTSTSWIKNE